MFKSKIRPIVIPQYEHGRLAGTLAAMWGNDQFERPVFDMAAFVQGVAFHDWHYGVIDDLPIGEASEADWLTTVRKGVDHWFDDAITDIVAKLHIRRLLSGVNTPESKSLIDCIEARIAERMPQSGYSRQQFEWADKTTRFCDQLAFDFSFEAPITDTRSVYAKIDANEETAIGYTIKAGGWVEVGPWPFSVDATSGIIIGYQQAGYPEELTPEVVPFQICWRA
jgi:hypothetical protein